MRKTNKIIGIYADAFNGKVGQTFAYMQFLSQFGYIRLISTCDNLENITNEIDMLVIPGGADVDSALYDGVPGVMDGRVNQHYEYLDKVLIPKFINSKKPIVGICRGMQALNVYFGGTMNQHIIGHQQGEDRAATKQALQLVETNEQIMVNTMHHQSIDRLGAGLIPLGYTQVFQGCYSKLNHVIDWKMYDKNNKVVSSTRNYGTIEVIAHDTLPIIGFQYHPEEFNCRYAVEKITELLQN